MKSELGVGNVLRQALREVENVRHSPEGRSVWVQGYINGRSDAAFHRPDPPDFDGSTLSNIELTAYYAGYGEGKKAENSS
jgi:hypothetical protein